MVCDRCIEAVAEEFKQLRIPVKSIALGEVLLEELLSSELKTLLQEALKRRGFEMLEDKNAQLIERIKALVIESIHRTSEPLKTNYSTYLERGIAKDYRTLSQLFSEVEGITIERYIILQKVERVKELLVYNELNSSQIAYQLGYSSVQHLSGQFKKVTGMSPSTFKKLQKPSRRSLDSVE
ncbi:MAG: AraC family transcriptional regulator [Cyclobacteriaceae bacterium]|nr:AraC family transcriptional regulator [Cyclobacteriaceae bacterium HetDA_MAG_MS6]